MPKERFYEEFVEKNKKSNIKKAKNKVKNRIIILVLIIFVGIFLIVINNTKNNNSEIEKISGLANDFRKKISVLPFETSKIDLLRLLSGLINSSENPYANAKIPTTTNATAPPSAILFLKFLLIYIHSPLLIHTSQITQP